MADRYCDHGAYGASNRLGLNNPVWGVPQDGDGTSPSVSTTAGTALISFSATPTSGTISVCGVTISTSGVLNAASADAAANALATNINATTTTVATGVSAGVPQLRNMVFARGPSGGAPSGTCQIMMRVGATSLNHATNPLCLIATTFNNVTSNAASHQFSGGVGGCWGWVWNLETALGVASSIIPTAYGVIGSSRPIGGTVADGDVVHIRAGKLVAFTESTSREFHTMYQCGTPQNPVEFRVDDGTVWTADAGQNLVFEFNYGGGLTTAFNLVHAIHQNSQVIFSGAKYANGTRNWRWIGNSNSPSNYMCSLRWLPTPALFKNLHIEDAGTATNNGALRLMQAGVTLPASKCAVFEDCFVGLARNRTIQFRQANYRGKVRFIGCHIDMKLAVAPADVVIEMTSGQANIVEIIGTKFTGFVSGSTLFSPNGRTLFYILNSELGNITKLGASAMGRDLLASEEFVWVNQVVNSAQKGYFFYEDNLGQASWDPNSNQPVLNALLIDGVTKTSLRANTTSVSSLLSRTSAFRLPPIVKVNTLGDTPIQYALEFLADKTLPAPTGSTIWVECLYVDSTGAHRTESTFGGAIAASGVSWYPEDVSGSPFFGALTYNKHRISASTSAPVKAGTEVTFVVSVCQPSSNAAQFYFFDPSPSMGAA
ncbi:hypothetical protein [Thauera sp. 27]|uniref:hypothetical protein n=1 Tax=Thauera sp. 27 TaxID=305700 RepID=UPI0012FB79B5|nr:hypothetical protein [Thauera sp. 27]